MEKKFILMVVALFLYSGVLGQTCTISSSANWGSATCQEGGGPSDKSLIIVPDGVTLTIPNSGPEETINANLIIYGTFVNDKPNTTVNGNIEIKSTGTFTLNQKLDIGSDSPSCTYSLTIETGGKMILDGNGGSDLLTICGTKIAQSGGGCITCDGDPNPPDCPLTDDKPYCEPTGGFQGPATYDRDGYSAPLPIQLLYFKGSSLGLSVSLEWATTQEENFDYFDLERSVDGRSFQAIGRIQGLGDKDVLTRYTYPDNLERSGRYYYRLKNVDLDRSFEYSKTIAVTAGEMSDKIVIYPNPVVKRKFHIKGLHGSLHFVFYDQLGKVQSETSVEDSQQDVVLSNNTPDGVYFVKITGPGFVEIVKVVVQSEN